MELQHQKIRQNMAQLLLEWYKIHARVLPFRTHSTPYRVWISEIMLQQTRVSAALEHYARFMQELPTIQHLAECPEEKLLKLWEGLGYYSRARNLQKSAKIIMEEHGGELPADYQQLLALPGIGEYTAGAIGSISFGLPVAAVDGNVLRVFARLYNDDRNILQPQTKKDFSKRVLDCMPKNTPGDYNQALMDLGAMVCVPNGNPQCLICPLQSVCLAFSAGTTTDLPTKTPPKPRTIQKITVLMVQNAQGQYLLEKRSNNGLLAGLWQPVLVEQDISAELSMEFLKNRGVSVEFLKAGKGAKHIFSHIEWHMKSWCFVAKENSVVEYPLAWVTKSQLQQEYSLPGAFKVYKQQMLKEKKL